MSLKSAAQLVEIEDRLGAHNYHPLDVVLERGEGVWVWDVEGRRYLDCLSAYSSVNQGHCHPKIRNAMIEQSNALTITSRAFRNTQLPAFYEDIVRLTGAEKVLLMNTGAEAVESAIKIARKWAYEMKGTPENNAEIIAAENNFHGRTMAAISLSTDDVCRNGFGPLLTGVKTVKYGDIDALEAAITPDTAAFLSEPVQGEAGVIIPPDGYFRQVREVCKNHNTLFILDEIQTGLGRTGKLLAQEHEGVSADVTLLGKALSGGFYPVSAVLARKDILDVLKRGQHGSTFGGNPLACAVGRAALKALTEEGMIENAAEMGDYFISRLRRIRSNAVKEIRGRGLMIAIELDPAYGAARLYCDKLKSLGVLCKDTHEHSIRIAPPLVITRDEIDWAAERFAHALDTPE